MKKLFSLLLFFLSFGVLSFGQVSCQSNPLTQFGYNEPALGQSVTMSGCTGGYFHSFAFNKIYSTSGLTVTVTIYNGESNNPADKIYEQTNVAITDGAGATTITFGGGTGTLAYTSGNQYSIIIVSATTVPASADSRDDYTGGNIHVNGSFANTIDLLFDLFTTSANPLPVELTSFNAKSEAGKSMLNWQTTTEKNNEGFYIERSLDGENWETIDFVQGHGTTQETQNYTYIDERPLNIINYYRLKQIDYDGKFEYSKIIHLEIQESSNQTIKLFPNPAGNQVQIENSDLIGETVQVFSVHGQLVKEFKHQSNISNLLLTDMPSGIYFIKIKNQVQKLIVEK